MGVAAASCGTGGAVPADGATSDLPGCAGAGTICTWAGTGDPAFTGDGLAPTQTALYWPMDVEFAPDGAGYILDWQNHRVRRADASKVTTIIGTDEPGDGPVYMRGDETTPPGVLATSVSLNHPTDLQFTPDGRMILAAWHNHKIRVVELSSDFSEVACGSGPGFAGDQGAQSAALLNMPKAIALAPSGDLYIADTRNFRVRRVAADSGIIDTVVGTGKRGATGDGGDPLQATLSFQQGLDQADPGGGGDNPEPGGALALDDQGRLYIADTENHRIRRVDFALGLIETVAGIGSAGFSGDGGLATAAALNHPRDIELGPGGRLFIADTENQRVRAVDLASGLITTVAGAGLAGFSGDGGPAAEAALHRPFGVAFDAAGDLYISDTFNNRIRRVVQP
jgi:sugar lactone lactonase YvrE